MAFSLSTYGLQSCTSCPLCGSRYGQVGHPPKDKRPRQKVDGRGPVPAPIFLLGEAPGEEEDKTGEPFKGMSGAYLQSVLEDLALTVHVRIGNVNRCRPPNNRKPTIPEMEACAPWLRLELQATQPQIIVALGGTAMSWFLPNHKVKGTIGANVGKQIATYPIVDENDQQHLVPVIGCYHPAARDASLRAKIPDVLAQVAGIVGLSRSPSDTPVGRATDYGIEMW